MNPYSVPTEKEKADMLSAIGVESIADLFNDIPAHLYLDQCTQIPEGISEFEAIRKLQELSHMNTLGTSYLGCGSYDRIIPSAVSHLASLPPFLTSYTPYQPEISQGTLQAIFEYQSMICELTGMDVSNASLYDGHTAASEAVVMANTAKRKGHRLLVSSTIHPNTLRVIRTHISHSDLSITVLPATNGVVTLETLESMMGDDVVGVLVQSPNIMGYLEDYTGFADCIHSHKAQFIISSDPIALGIIPSQNDWNADIAIGDIQPFGVASCFGGPSAGYIAVKEKMLRKLPGRIVGETVDTHGQRSFVLTLQAREQHIKRERATSNICSNQAHVALTAAIYMSLVGWRGIQQVAEQSYHKAHYLFNALTAIDGVEPVSGVPFIGEFTLRLGSSRRAKMFLDEMRSHGIFAGVHLGDLAEEFDGLITVSVTEKRTKSEMDSYIAFAKEVLS